MTSAFGLRALALTAAASSVLTVGAMRALSGPAILRMPRLENAKVKVTEITHPPGVPRETHVRPSDQVIVFMDDCQYERRDATTGERRTVTRKAGEAIWHDKGEHAPQLTNTGTRPYRTMLVEIK